MQKSFVSTLFATAHETSRKVKPRSKVKVYLHLLSELGEIGEEANIACGELYKEKGKDGLTGEAADVINCLADLIWVCAAPDTDMDDVLKRLSQKAEIEEFDDADWLAVDLKQARDVFARATCGLGSIHAATEDTLAVSHAYFLDTAAQLVAAVLVLAKSEDPGLTEERFLAIFEAKCAKWLAKAG